MGTYNKTFINSPKAPVNQRIEAIYDYVGAVYGSNKDAKYDGNLTVAERQSVIGEFGEFRLNAGKLESQEIESYLAKAKEKFFQRLNLLGRCQWNPELSLYKTFQSQKIGEAQLLSVPHDCALQLGSMYFSNGVELQVAANPNVWVFFVEGFGSKETEGGEAALFRRLSEVLGQIPIYNPLEKNTFSLSVMQEASKKTKRSVLEYQAIALGQVFLTMARRGAQLSDETLDQAINVLESSYQRLKPGYQIDRDKLKEAYFQFVWEKKPSSTREVYQALARDGALHRKLAQKQNPLASELTQACNEINAREVRESLRGNPKRKRALFQLGLVHVPLVESIYGAAKKAQ